MVKYKRADDGVFTIVDIKPEGVKRKNIALIVCKNDINDELFECHLSATLKEQEQWLREREKHIGHRLFITFGERSGVNNLPFHVKKVIPYD